MKYKVAKKLVPFRCPVTLLEDLKQISQVTGCNFTELTEQSIQLLIRYADKNGGFLFAPYTISAMNRERKHLSHILPYLPKREGEDEMACEEEMPPFSQDYPTPLS